MPSRQFGAVAVAGALHVALVYALMNGMASQIAEVVWTPTQVKLVEAPPPPPPPPPPPLPSPPLVAPAPLYVPPPAVRIDTPPPAPPMTVTTKAPPISDPPPVLPVPPASPRPTPAPVALVLPAPPPHYQARAAALDVARCDRPAYPATALRQQVSGTTRIRFRVDAAGRVQQSELLRPSGVDLAHRALDRAAIDALSRCAFKPGIDEQGLPVGGDAVVDYVWNLEQ